MSDDMKTVIAGEYTLVARCINGEYRGAVWTGGKIIRQIQGLSIDDVWRKTVELLCEQQESLAQARQGAEPTSKEAEAAFKRIAPRLTAGHKAMLRAHLHAQDQSITATQLSEAAGYANYSAANLQYGLLGAMLYSEMPQELPRRADGTRIMTCVIASSGDLRKTPEEQWVWKMRPYIAEGLQAAGIL